MRVVTARIEGEVFCRALRESKWRRAFWKAPRQDVVAPRQRQALGSNTDGQKRVSGEDCSGRGFTKSKPGVLLDESEVAERVRSSGIDEQTEDKLIDNLWRSSVGAICYDMMRISAVHFLGTSTLSFDQTLYEGKLGIHSEFRAAAWSASTHLRAHRDGIC